MQDTKNIGYIVGGPAEFLIHRRRGKIKHQGRGISFVCLPVIDRFYRIPSTAQALTFAADQITSENQGVEVSGFAIWRICEPERASESFDFTASGNALETISANLKDVVESAIRHQVANMTIEDVLRKRGTIILQLKEELAYMAEQWGLTIETVEIKNVRIMSAQLFANMQARFRDSMRLQSETSEIETARLIAEQRYQQREHLAAREQKAKRKELELEEELLEMERGIVEKRFAAEIARGRHHTALGLIEDELAARRTETANRANPTLGLIEKLPAALGALKINELNLQPDTLERLMRGVDRLLGQGRGS